MEAVEKAINQETHKEKWQLTLERLYGSSKDTSKKPFTKEIKEKMAREHTPDEAKELMKRFGLEKFRK